MFSEGLLGSSVQRLNPKEIGGKVYAMIPKKRKYHIRPEGQPVKIVGPKDPPTKFSMGDPPAIRILTPEGKA